MLRVPEIFEKKTIKSIDSIFNMEEYKELIRLYIEYGEWFTVAGLRRTGKTTLVRSIVASMKIPAIYVNLWTFPQGEVSLKILLDKILEKLNEAFSGKIRTIGKRVKEVTIFGIRITFSSNRPSDGLTKIIERTIKAKEKLIIMLDEVQELGSDFGKLIRYLAALHDLFSPNLVVILLGSVISLKNILKRVRGTPLRGRLTKEIILQPFDTITAMNFLKKGFGECGIDIPDDVLKSVVEYLGGFPGWLVEFGKTFIEKYAAKKKYPNPREVLLGVYEEAKETIYEEIAKLVAQRKKLLNYIKLLTYTARNLSITPSEAAEALRIQRSTAHKYLKYLQERAILNSRDGVYYIVDPLIRRALAEPNAKEQIISAYSKL